MHARTRTQTNTYTAIDIDTTFTWPCDHVCAFKISGRCTLFDAMFVLDLLQRISSTFSQFNCKFICIRLDCWPIAWQKIGNDKNQPYKCTSNDRCSSVVNWRNQFKEITIELNGLNCKIKVVSRVNCTDTQNQIKITSTNALCTNIEMYGM